MAKFSRLAMGALVLRVALEPRQVWAAEDANGRALLDILIDERLYGLAGHVVWAGPSVCRVTKLTVEALMAAVYRGDDRAVGILSRSGVDLGAMTSIPHHGPLSLAICTGRGNILDILLGAGAEPSVQSLTWAVDRKESSMFRQLLDHSPSPLPTCLHFLLHMAASAGVCDCVDALLAAGCDINGEDCEGMRPLDLCPRKGKVYSLLQRQGGLHSLRYAASNNNTELLMAALWREFRAPNCPYRTCEEQQMLDWHLVAASASGSRIAVEAMLDWGADPSAMVSSPSPPKKDTSIAAETHRPHHVKVDPIPLRKFCMTALHAAACRGHSAVCHILMTDPRTQMWARTQGGPAAHHQAARLARQRLWWNPLVEGPNRSPVMLSNRGRVASELAWEAGYPKLASKLDWEMIIRKVCEDANAATISERGDALSTVAPGELAKARA
ncbi:hypothetical protein FOZ60_004915 [Perkinsus olseni]|uniref:Ankyrin Repeat Protein n=2 Tax=Perkinsus olseni TaxID=32597 RepID=A0A7J6PGU0_PEROL|nr:hypothetical protein FOZ60_004915 [Perkinsus olseni]